MTEDELWHIFQYWSFWDKAPKTGIPRTVQIPSLDPQLVLAVQGVRRCGKSTLLAQLLERFRLEPTHCLLVNFEDPRLSPQLGPELLFRLVELFRDRRGPGPLWFLFDEVQNVPGWEGWLHTMLERNQSDHYVVTGSNASLLSGELSSKLSGRHRLVELYPFDYAEALSARAGLTPERYLDEGGFPKVVLSADNLELRQQYFRDIVERDITNRVGARSSGPVLATVHLAFESCGAELSLRRLAAACGLSADTVSIYLAAAESAYLLFSCPFFSHSRRQQQVRNKKYYPVDPGLRKAVIATAAPELGKGLETAAYLALRRRFREVYYWRNLREVDFVVLHQGRPLPVQVTWNEPLERHQAGLDEFYTAFPRAHEAIFLTAEDLQDNFSRLP